MEEKINELYTLIADYRIDDNLITLETIRQWIEQFHEEDREFVLTETSHIMKQRYISLDTAKELLKRRIEFLSKEYDYESPKSFLKDIRIIDHQPEGKSQKILLNIFYEICSINFDFDLNSHFNLNAKYYLYLDDVLCTGDTIFKGLAINDEKNKGFFNKTQIDGRKNLDIFNENEAKLLLGFFCIHKKNIYKVIKRIEYGLGEKIPIHYSWNGGLEIDNSYEQNCKFNYFILSESNKSQKVIDCENQIKNKLQTSNYYSETDFIYRPDGTPDEENLYSSKENRERYEKIISDICIEIYNSSEGLLNNIRARPLGYGLRLENSLGFGTLFFTWRNVPFNTPLIFWYEHNGWLPLFKRNYIEY